MELEQMNLEPEISYFGLQAYVGTTKHLGGFETTQKLIELCHIAQARHVLEVGTGVGATACYLAREYDCRIVGVDVRETMITRCRERAHKEGVSGQVEFRAADAQDLPFEDAQFDVVFCESVVTFVKDKQRATGEFARVVKPGGYVGLNEEIWLKPPPSGVAEQVARIWDIDPGIPTAAGWTALLAAAGLQDLVVQTYAFDARREASQLKRYRLADIWKMVRRTVGLYLSNPEFREYMGSRRRLPKDTFEYLGYALVAGQKRTA
jgi:ubiquinone/menaquinone biosynthesis C-methylase UbiE